MKINACCAVVVFTLGAGTGIRAWPAGKEMDVARLYQVQTELTMPHLEENLRYSITHAKRCLTEMQMEVLFSALEYSSLAGCHLVDRRQDNEKIAYTLACSGGHGTTGTATWEMGRHQMIGTLDVKLGGKNMTFFERVTARPLGACSP
jgi:hypothetical protein